MQKVSRRGFLRALTALPLVGCVSVPRKLPGIDVAEVEALVEAARAEVTSVQGLDIGITEPKWFGSTCLSATMYRMGPETTSHYANQLFPTLVFTTYHGIRYCGRRDSLSGVRASSSYTYRATYAWQRIH